ncbi:hypothetical protein NPIL_319361 [Nephila pilipes]|uniref:Uncharacterized protein n=1 Tax=Nephila pilipes TaxID=299642 RepID=A0A8X6N2K8_NEPPI|nr:hypothetical protein NPIL_319361 [Nephila pilipes]
MRGRKCTSCQSEGSLSSERYLQHLGQRTRIKHRGSNFLINRLIFTLSYFIGCASHLTDVHRTLTYRRSGDGLPACELIKRLYPVREAFTCWASLSDLVCNL